MDDKRNSLQMLTTELSQANPPTDDSHSPPVDLSAGLASDHAMAERRAVGAPVEVAIEDLNDLFAAVITRLADCAVEPPREARVVQACVQALQQLHLTAANELARRQQRIDALLAAKPGGLP